MPRWLEILTLATALGTGLVAGTFFAFSTFVMPALKALPPTQGIAAMNSVNVVIVRSLFMPVFVGAALACIVLGFTALFYLRRPFGWWLLAGGLLYLIGSFGETLAVNVPLNDALAATQPASPEAVAYWQHYLGSWTSWNSVRAVASLLTTLALIVAGRLE